MAALAAAIVCLSHSCREKQNGGIQRGDPVLHSGTPVFDEATKTFSLTVSADSTDGAKTDYALLEGDSVIMQNDNGQFTGIAPFDEGYHVRLQAQWDDTTIVKIVHVQDFVAPKEPVEKITKDELQRLINAKDESLKRGQNSHLSQGVKLSVVNSQMHPQMLPDVITLIENKIWQSVEIVKMSYDDNNLVNAITVKPVGEQVDIDDDEDLDY